jgi:virginiamycin A acetyltransferase
MLKLRHFIWRILGFDYKTLLLKTDYTLLKNDRYTQKGVGTYDNGAKVWRWTKAPLKVGKYCSIAHDVNFIVDEGHHTISTIANFPLINNLFQDKETIVGQNKSEFMNQFSQREGIEIGNDVWLGMGSYVLPGVRVGNGAVIAANSVVTKDVPDYAVIGGAPAVIIKMKHDTETIKSLNEISWWDWDKELLKERITDFYDDSSSFIKKFKTNAD